MAKDYASFIRISEKKYIEKLFYEGEVHCKPIRYFRKIDNKDFRGDKNEGAAYIKQISIHKINELQFSGQLYGYHPDDLGNIYCLFGVEEQHLNLKLKSLQKLNLNMNGLPFGDTGIIIFDPGEFISRIEKEANKNGFQFQCSSIHYYDHELYEGELTPFHKSKIYMEQNEVRFWISNKVDNDQKFIIGDISDIAYIFPKTLINDFEYEPL
jgi:hypothetical protein